MQAGWLRSTPAPALRLLKAGTPPGTEKLGVELGDRAVLTVDARRTLGHEQGQSVRSQGTSDFLLCDRVPGAARVGR